MAGYSNKALDFVRKHPLISALSTITLTAGVIFRIINSSGLPVFECYNGTGCVIKDRLTVQGVVFNTGATTSYFAGQGLTLSNSFFRLNASHSGTQIQATSLLASSGALIIEGATTLHGTVRINGVTYTFPPSDGSASGKVLKTDGAGKLSWSTDNNSGGSTELSITNSFPQAYNIIFRAPLFEPSLTRVELTNDFHLTDNATVTSAAGTVSWCDNHNLAAQFTAANSEYLSRADHATLSPTSDITYLTWVYVDSAPGAGTAQSIASKYDNGDRAWYFRYEEDSGLKLKLYIEDAATDSVNVGVAQDLGTATWHHVGFVYNDAGQTVTFYVDGAQVGTPQTATGVDDLADSAADFRIGTFSGGAGPASFWGGRQSDAIWWNNDLTAAEVASVYNRYNSAGSGCLLPI